MKRIVCLMLSVTLLFSCSFSASAYYDQEKTEETIVLSEDGLVLLIENCADVPDLSDYGDLNEIVVINSVISNPDFIKDTTITITDFKDCIFDLEYIHWPKNLDMVNISECEFKSPDIF